MSFSPDPRVSVVIPLYQKGPYLQRALRSVFGQTLGEFEVVVIDDGSSDEGPSLLGGFTDTRLVAERQDHQGVSVARNRGIARARAPWVAFLDADDEWHPSFLESTLELARTTPQVAAVFSNLMDFPTRRSLLTHVDLRGPLVRDYFRAVIENNGTGMSSSSVLASKSRLTALGGFREGVHFAEDTDLWARLAWSGDVAYCPEPLAIYHSEVPGSTTKDVQRAAGAYPTVLRSYEDWAGADRIPDRLRRSSRRYANWVLARHVMELAHQGLKEQARRTLDRASWRDATDPILWKARLWTHLPAGLLRLGRNLRKGPAFLTI